MWRCGAGTLIKHTLSMSSASFPACLPLDSYVKGVRWLPFRLLYAKPGSCRILTIHSVHTSLLWVS